MPTNGNQHLARLRKILEHERNLDCQDTGVVGGLEALVTRWAHENATGALQTPLLAVARHLAGYTKMTARERRTSVAHAIAELEVALPKPAEHGDQPPSVPPLSHASDARAPVTRPCAADPPQGTTPSPATRRTSPSAAPQRAAVHSEAPTATQLDVPIVRLRGVSAGYARPLKRLNISTVHDLLYHFPRRYVDYRNTKRIKDLTIDEAETVVATIWEVRARRARSGISVIELVAGDDTGTVGAVWFNQPHLTKSLLTNRQIVLSGRIELGSHGEPYFKSPDWEVLGDQELVHVGRLVPVHPLTEGISGRWLRRLVKLALDRWSHDLVDPLPKAVRRDRALVDLQTAVWQMHFPDDEVMTERARRRLAFDELLLIQLAMLGRHQAWVEDQCGHAFPVDRGLVDRFVATLPFQLTAGQQKAVEGILADMAKPVPMARLLQGDVGSGKTVVAAIAMLVAAANGLQSALMAPTEILAEQHMRTLSGLFDRFGPLQRSGQAGIRPFSLQLLTGSLRKREKVAIYDQVADGTVDVIVGTHALIQERLEPARLGLVVVDEQHRFGVEQRSALRSKGNSPDVLVMTATPIPRTLALTIYGDLDISTITELPPGRQKIKTLVLGTEQRDAAYDFVRRHVASGDQAFVICPLVEESEKIEAKAATAEHERLGRDVFPELRLGLLHGRLASREKEAVMRAFRDGDLDVLVSTAVVEVGIDVPNATIMLVEGADRFGLAQLHQFRGRVGRGSKESYCILLADAPTAEAEERLQVLARVDDGCALAEEDLRLRGPGELLGTRQSGLPELRVATLADLALIEETRACAQRLLAVDPQLAQPEHRLLARELGAFWQRAASDFNG